MGKAIRIHLNRNGKQTFCGISIHKELPMAIKGENFFMNSGNPIKMDCLCKNCVSLMAKNPIYRNYIELVKYNESIMDYEAKLPKTKRAMKLYCAKRQLNWNKKNSKLSNKLEMKHTTNKSNSVNSNPNEEVIELTDVVGGTIDPIPAIDPAIEKAAIANSIPTEIDSVARTEKGLKRELRKAGLLPNEFKKVDKSIGRIQDGMPIAIINGFGNCWKVIEEFTSIGNCNGSNVKELSGWVQLDMARKIYNQALIARLSD